MSDSEIEELAEFLTPEQAQRRFNPLAFRHERGPPITTPRERAARSAARAAARARSAGVGPG